MQVRSYCISKQTMEEEFYFMLLVYSYAIGTVSIKMLYCKLFKDLVTHARRIHTFYAYCTVL